MQTSPDMSDTSTFTRDTVFQKHPGPHTSLFYGRPRLAMRRRRGEPSAGVRAACCPRHALRDECSRCLVQTHLASPVRCTHRSRTRVHVVRRRAGTPPLGPAPPRRPTAKGERQMPTMASESPRYPRRMLLHAAAHPHAWFLTMSTCSLSVPAGLQVGSRHMVTRTCRIGTCGSFGMCNGPIATGDRWTVAHCLTGRCPVLIVGSGPRSPLMGCLGAVGLGARTAQPVIPAGLCGHH